ncbi:hypothetical protein DFH11DRAFT_1296988 [Phellopilus nigrolimitatus]|nr:hypothetical protein DFH11DRAFT_1296988 [Phellopilus nigrolimitatus]
MPLIVAPPPPSPTMLSQPTYSPPVSSRTSTALTSPKRSPILKTPRVAASQPTSGEVTIVVEREREEEPPRFPTATLDTESISDVMAARLATCLLGHVLYLKNQVPFPVAQLLRMSFARKTDPRSAKKQDALLSAFDLLSSHLGSTFTALSAALATGCGVTTTFASKTTATTHLAIILGPSVTSVSAARARVVLELDGLRVHGSSTCEAAVFSPRVAPNGHLKENSDRNSTERADVGVAEHRKSFGGPGLGSTMLQGPLSSEDSEGSDNEDEGSDEDDADDLESVPDSSGEEDLESESSFQEEDEDELEGWKEEEADLCAAERLLSRALAVANADPELGMAAELSLTQTHILLRAPRRFAHPAWIPRQNLTRDMDVVLREFEHSPVESTALANITNSAAQNGSGKTAARQNGLAAKRKVGLRTECVRVRARAGERADEREGEDESGRNDEEDEMIWWSWDGKLEGFADW